MSQLQEKPVDPEQPAEKPAPIEKDAIDFRGTSINLTSLRLLRPDLNAIKAHLDLSLEKSGDFFRDAPVMLDLSMFSEAAKSEFSPVLDLRGVVTILRARRLVPVGVRYGTDSLKRSARSLGLGVFADETMVLPKEPVVEPEPEPEPEPVPTAPLPKIPEDSEAPVEKTATRIIDHPVRSGQRVYARNGDLIVLGPVNGGGEVLADGNIHVYGPLRGRALAGAGGDTEARIFCHELDAQLVAIAGIYQVSEFIPREFNCSPAQIWLADDLLEFAPLV
ncbi:MAG: septum site-determining protein MinC [Magnetococcales bacterium]|nr:septum site-determining protein MinC [Magnetococcales bacterium]